ncbi:hypothetical protein SHKM778_83490 [Streptomyces sp. KM77-8]|uniref:Uncharacterized protein n=1 Tax=Streptomyces haneummycinicus TaxID=3074435 RepID=A0AAT9HXH5_9ACTN
MSSATAETETFPVSPVSRSVTPVRSLGIPADQVTMASLCGADAVTAARDAPLGASTGSHHSGPAGGQTRPVQGWKPSATVRGRR